MNPAWVRVWGWPVAIALVSATGLASALVADGLGDVWSWFALALPTAVGCWCAWPRRAPQPEGDTFSSRTSALHAVTRCRAGYRLRSSPHRTR